MTPRDAPAFEEIPSPISSSPRARWAGLAQRFAHVREQSRKIVAPLSPEDMTPQSMPDASPVKWHLAHTSWFFETFLLLPQGWKPYDPAFQYLFNSYYEALGERQARPARGLVTRPNVAEVMAYRAHVDAAMGELFGRGSVEDLAPLLALGLAHEEQHQELMLTDVLHLFAQNKLRPAYMPAPAPPTGRAAAPLTFTRLDGGIVAIGHEGEDFAFDNEGPRHETLLRPFQLADRLVTNGEWMEFIADGGYRRPELWLSDGWALRQAEAWEAPLYWQADDGSWLGFGLRGLRPLQADAPAVHVSLFEADAYARWRDARLPTESEWEIAAASSGDRGAWLDDGDLTPRPAPTGGLTQMFGDVWEWTSSPYVGYPGFRPAQGAVGEYNGKFMINQIILRGGSCVTPAGHVRATYRNFFQAHQRWQFSGVRLALDA